MFIRNFIIVPVVVVKHSLLDHSPNSKQRTGVILYAWFEDL